LSKPPFIFDIQRSSLVDGPGIRTIVFFKGCPLQCSWCQNPESQSSKQELIWYQELCKYCNACKIACNYDAIIDNIDEYKVDKTKCIICGECITTCNYNAIRTIGQEHTVRSLVDVIMKDETYFNISGGGVTFSGGEPLMFMEYLTEVCEKLKEANVDIAIQTSGYFDFETFEKKISPYISTIYFDLKIADEELHRYYTKKSNKLILHNLHNLFSPKKHKIIIRTPLIRGITDTFENLTRIKEIISEYDHDGYEQLLFNDSYDKKLKSLGRVN